MGWREDSEEIIELLYRIQIDHKGSIAESSLVDIGLWATDAAEKAKRLWCLVAKGSPPTLRVTNGGRKALEAALASREETPQPHWFGGSIIPVHSETGPVLPPHSYKPYEELQTQALEQGVLTQEDIDRISRSPRRGAEEPEKYRGLEQIFPGMRAFAIALEYAEDHPLGGGPLDPAGSEGAYLVTATLTRRGAPDITPVYVTDAYTMEGDSHLWLPEESRTADGGQTPSIVYTFSDGSETHFELLTNSRGRLGQIRTILRAQSINDARRISYRLLNPFLCDLSYRYDIPIDVLQTNIAELATLTLSGMKQDDFREKLFDPEQFIGSGISYETIPLYEFFTRLYREGINSSNVDYGFLCLYRIAESVITLRRRRVAEQRDMSWKDVPRPEVFFDNEVVERVDYGEELFPADLLGKSLWLALKRLREDRTKIGHGFLDEEDPLEEYADIINDRMEGEERAGIRRSQARYIARRMLGNEFWTTD